jgi:hypothetical protein
MALDKVALFDFAHQKVVEFHQKKSHRIDGLTLTNVLQTKNPYLFRAKNLSTAAELIDSILDAFLSSSEEQMFGNLLESVAREVSRQVNDGVKSTAKGVDLEFSRGGIRYIVSIKSGPNWGNSDQWKRLDQNLRTAAKVYMQGGDRNVQPVLGICYGKRQTTYKGVFWQYTGQAFWHFLSGDSQLYLELIEPIGREAKKHNDAIQQKRSSLSNRMTAEFIQNYCSADYCIDWEKLVVFNSGNMQ